MHIENRNGKPFVFDVFRQKWVAYTPEEKIRQQFCTYLLLNKQYPQVAIANEHLVCLNGQPQRCDTVVFVKARPAMVVEYKAPSVPINNAVLQQALRYNTVLKVPVVVVSNGLHTYAYHIHAHTGQVECLSDIPLWDQLSAMLSLD